MENEISNLKATKTQLEFKKLQEKEEKANKAFVHSIAQELPNFKYNLQNSKITKDGRRKGLDADSASDIAIPKLIEDFSQMKEDEVSQKFRDRINRDLSVVDETGNNRFGIDADDLQLPADLLLEARLDEQFSESEKRQILLLSELSDIKEKLETEPSPEVLSSEWFGNEFKGMFYKSLYNSTMGALYGGLQSFALNGLMQIPGVGSAVGEVSDKVNMVLSWCWVGDTCNKPDPTMMALDKISSQIEDLKRDMTENFNTVLEQISSLNLLIDNRFGKIAR